MISVIIPLYNKEQTIERSLRSVLSQDYDDFEVIVVNDGSTDGSAEIVKSIPDFRIVFVEQENGGPSKARNTGVKCSKGDWIVFLDADDELKVGSLNYFCCLIEEEKDCDFFLCGFDYIIGKQIIHYSYRDGLVSNPFKYFFLGSFVPHTGSTIFSRALVLKCPFNTKYRRFEDYETWFRMFHCAKVYSGARSVLNVNNQFADASNTRKSISDDFVGHIDFHCKSFWERMCLYRLFIEERERYPKECHQIYRKLYYRFDYFILMKLINFFYKKILYV